MNLEINTTYEEKVKMYGKMKKKDLIAMLIEANRLLRLLSGLGGDNGRNS